MWGIRRSATAAVVSAIALAAGAASASAQTTYTWTGAAPSTNHNFSTAANWDANGSPSPGADTTINFPELNSNPACIVQPRTDACYRAVDDDAGQLSIGSLTLDDADNYAITADSSTAPAPSLSLGSGGIQAVSYPQSRASDAQILLPTALSAPQTWSFGGDPSANNQPGELIFGQAVTGAGENLAISASSAYDSAHGTPTVQFGAGADVGAISVAGVDVDLLNGSDLNGTDASSVAVSGSSLAVPGAGSEIGPLTLTGATLLIGGFGSPPDATLQVNGNASADPDSTLVFHIDQNGSVAGADFSQLTSTGIVSLGGSSLQLEQGYGPGLSCQTLSAGDQATLISAGTISGTFAGLPNGTIGQLYSCSSVNPIPVEINYTGSTVTATVMDQTTTALQVPAPPTTNQAVTLTATVIGTAAVPAGTVAFANGGAVIPGCASQPLTASSGDSATATCTTSFAAASSPESLTAAYAPSSASLASSTSSPTTLLVTQSSTTTSLSVSSATPSVGSSVTYTATVTPGASGVVAPTGTVQFLDGGTPISSCPAQSIGSGTVTCTTSYAGGGSHAITAAYGGDGNFVGSTSPIETVSVPTAGGSLHLPAPGSDIPWLAGRAKVSGTTVTVPVRCQAGLASCVAKLQLIAIEKVQNGNVVSVSGRALASRARSTTRRMVAGSSTITIAAGQRKKFKVSLNRLGRRLLAARHPLKLTLELSQSFNGVTTTGASKTVTFRLARKH